jgi:hypothetical protein
VKNHSNELYPVGSSLLLWSRNILPLVRISLVIMLNYVLVIIAVVLVVVVVVMVVVVRRS